MKLKAVSAFIVNDKKQILLLKRSNSVKSYRGFWQFPEGKPNKNESEKQTLKREIEEELGCKLKIFKNLGSYSYKHYFLFFPIFDIERVIFSVEIPEKITLSHEHTDYAWVSQNRIENYQLLPGLDKIINEVYTKIKQGE